MLYPSFFKKGVPSLSFSALFFFLKKKAMKKDETKSSKKNGRFSFGKLTKTKSRRDRLGYRRLIKEIYLIKYNFSSSKQTQNIIYIIRGIFYNLVFTKKEIRFFYCVNIPLLYRILFVRSTVKSACFYPSKGFASL